MSFPSLGLLGHRKVFWLFNRVERVAEGTREGLSVLFRILIACVRVFLHWVSYKAFVRLRVFGLRSLRALGQHMSIFLLF